MSVYFVLFECILNLPKKNKNAQLFIITHNSNKKLFTYIQYQKIYMFIKLGCAYSYKGFKSNNSTIIAEKKV